MDRLTYNKKYQNFDMDKMNSLLTKSKDLMDELKVSGLLKNLPGLNLPGM